MDQTIYRGDIYYAELTGCSGSEQGGLRPVLVVQNDIGNKYSPTTLIAPLTSRLSKTHLPTHVFLDAHEYGLKSNSIVLLEQIRVFDKNRLKGYVASIDENKMREVLDSLAINFCGIGYRMVAIA